MTNQPSLTDQPLIQLPLSTPFENGNEVSTYSISPRIAVFLDGHMQGRQLAINSDQERLTFQKLDKPYLESEPNLITVDYRKVDERPETKEYIFKTVEGILNDAVNA